MLLLTGISSFVSFHLSKSSLAISLIGLIETIVLGGVAYFLYNVSNNKGRELIESNEVEIEIIFAIVLTCLILDFILNVCFVMIYYFIVIALDDEHRQ